MYQKSISLSDKSDSLIIDWGQDWSNLSIRQKGRLVGSFHDKQELELGHRFVLANGQEILVILRDTGLEVWHQGKDLVSSTASGQVPTFDEAVSTLQLLGFLQLGAVPPLLFNVLEGVGIGPAIAGGLLSAALLIGAGLWIKRTGDKTLFWLGMGFCVFDLGLLYLTLSRHMWELSIVIAVLFGGFMVKIYQGIGSTSPTVIYRRDWGQDAPLDSDM